MCIYLYIYTYIFVYVYVTPGTLEMQMHCEWLRKMAMKNKEREESSKGKLPYLLRMYTKKKRQKIIAGSMRHKSNETTHQGEPIVKSQETKESGEIYTSLFAKTAKMVNGCMRNNKKQENKCITKITAFLLLFHSLRCVLRSCTIPKLRWCEIEVCVEKCVHTRQSVCSI